MDPKNCKLYFNGWDFYKHVIKSLSPKRVLDLGANEGGFFDTWIQLGAEVHAFEPVPYLAEILRKKYGKRIVLNQLAVSDVELNYNHVNVCRGWFLSPKETHNSTIGSVCPEEGKRDAFAMQTVVLDSYLEKTGFNPDFIKMDVDGYESKALRGLARFLSNNTPPMLFELSSLPRLLGESVENMCRMIYDLGYYAVSMDGSYVCQNASDMISNIPIDSSYDIMLIPKSMMKQFGLQTP